MDEQRIEDIIVRHCKLGGNGYDIARLYAMQIEFCLDDHERVAGRYTEQENVSELKDHLRQALAIWDKLSPSTKRNIGTNSTELEIEQRVQQLAGPQLMETVSVTITKKVFDNKTGKPLLDKKTGEPTITRKTKQMEKPTVAEPNRHLLRVAAIKSLHQGIQNFEKSKILKYLPPRHSMVTEGVAIAAACWNIWKQVFGSTKLPTTNASAFGPLGKFIDDVYDHYDIKYNPATAIDNLKKLGGEGALTFSVVRPK